MTTIKAGLYLRNGALVTPGILTFDNDLLTFKTAEGSVFELQSAGTQIAFSSYGTITVRNAQQSWDLIGGAYAGAFPAQFSEEQMNELRSSETNIALAAKTRGDRMIYGNNPTLDIAPVVNGGKGYGLGYLSLSDRQRSSFYTNLALVQLLQTNGFQVTIKAQNFSTSQWAILIVLIISIAVFGVALFAILSAIQG